TLAEERFRDLQYALAETENVRKRTERSATDRAAFARKALLGKFLPVLDNLQRALTYDDSNAVREGLNATLKGFEGLLASERIRPVDVLGKPFDPRFAEAIGTREAEGVDDDVVLEEVQRGYLLDDELIRPALVLVAKKNA
ncbi:MAG: nucleotide exchange factor GrpE, partial [Candidatus Eremiobacteraeota bacterium]|nr:nucleotide exchange factor GrpE [Candidatus Eremiobacteraeota bacterium]